MGAQMTDEGYEQFAAPNQLVSRAGKAEEVAELVTFLLSDKSKMITGSHQLIDGGWTLA
jgi:NAD(P)-dependent dehydrogenase (short-subunit alcohol dehydrogenase family)